MPNRGSSDGVDRKALGVAVGVFWSAFVVFVGISSRFGWGNQWEALLEDIYPGYNEGIHGLILGGIWGFIDGFLDAYVVGTLYNRFHA